MKALKKLFLLSILSCAAQANFAQCLDTANVYSFIYDGHFYEVVKENKTWTSAAACAVMRGGYLAEINDEAEQNAIFSELADNAGIVTANTQNEFGTASIWLGGSDAGEEGNWIWDGNNDGTGTQFWSGAADGTPVGGLYTNWGISPAEPDNSGGQDHLTIIIKTSAVNYSLWNDLVATNSLYYLIEYDGTVGIENNELKRNILIYPNPFEDVVTIENNNSETITTIIVLNMAGQIVKTINGSELIQNSIALSELEKGMYFLNIQFDNGETVTRKIIK